MGLLKDKKGITFNIFYVLASILVGIILLGTLAFIFHSIRGGLNQDIMIGQVNLSNVSESTFGVFDDALNTNLDLYGLFLIFGTIGGFFVASYMLRGKWNKLLIVVDLILMIAVYLLAVLISNSYETLLVASNGVISQFEGSMPKTSNFLLHLPRYIVIIGVVSMILFYTAIPRREDEQQGGVSFQEY
jgi:hypothetical protein